MQKINIKKVTKEQMLKMLEEAAEKQEAAEAEAAEHFKAGVKLAEENEKLRGEIGTLTEKLDQMNGEAITSENVIANLKADADVLRNKLAESGKELSEHRAATVRRLDELKKQLADTEAALGRANAEVSHYKSELRAARKGATDAQWAQIDEYRRAEYAESHPWRNLWAWVKRKLVRHE